MRGAVAQIIIFQKYYPFINCLIIQLGISAQTVVLQTVQYFIQLGQYFQLVPDRALHPYIKRIFKHFKIAAAFIDRRDTYFIGKGNKVAYNLKIKGYKFADLAFRPLRFIGNIARQVHYITRGRAQLVFRAAVKNYQSVYYIKKPIKLSVTLSTHKCVGRVYLIRKNSETNRRIADFAGILYKKIAVHSKRPPYFIYVRIIQ